MADRVTVELTRYEWVALLTAASFGTSEVESRFSGALAGVADRVIEQLQHTLGIPAIDQEADRVRRLLDITDQM